MGPDPPPPPPDVTETFVGTGDIGQCGLNGAALTAALLDNIPGTVFTTGDNAYPDGTGRDFAECYDPFWGRHKGRTRPTPGNHDYYTPGAQAYYNYFGAAANPPDGYYSYRLGAWQIFALNSEISAFPGSPQYMWLRNELTLNPTRCALAYFHHPVFGSGANGSNPHMQEVWRLLRDLGADVIVAGHNHSYERFAPQNADGGPDPARGIRQFVVGTGGAELTGFPSVRANSEVRNNTTWGVLKLTLRPDRYDWQFVPVAGQSFSDSGSDTCH
jgi:hypothetical protein